MIKPRFHPLFEEENGSNGSGDTMSPFAKFVAERSQSVENPNPEQKEGAKPQEKPASEASGGDKPQEGEQSLLDLAKTLAGGLKAAQKPEKKEEVKEAQGEEDPILAEIQTKLGPPPAADAGVSAQFEYVNKSREAMREKLVEINAEMKRMRETGQDKIDKAEYSKLIEDRKLLEEARSKDKETIDALKERLAQYDLREDPDYQERYVKPIRLAESDMVETINMVGGEDAETLQQNVVRVLSIQDDKTFRAEATNLAQQLDSTLDQQELRSKLFNLRKLYVEQQVALAKMPELQKEVFARKKERQAAEASAFLEAEVVKAHREMKAVDPIIAMMETGPLATLLDKQKGALSLVDTRIETILKEDITKRGAPSSDLAQVVVMAKQRMRERLVFGTLVENYIQQTEDYEALKAQYAKLTGKSWGTTLPEKIDAETGEKVESLGDLFRKRAATA